MNRTESYTGTINALLLLLFLTGGVMMLLFGKDLALAQISLENAQEGGITIACGGFYGPQGRQIRLKIQDPQQNEKVEAFEYDGLHICNFEMESSAVAGLAALLGHRAMTCCMVIANRYTTEMNTEYKNSIDTLIQKVLARI